ncbi:chemerin-like receptor 1 [Hoplias malabaricus]|uniref:chemerin-like receptor 1 n=1 Tax=Hoplias malabaricus TaxID=27720 RepID=UPI003461FA85
MNSSNMSTANSSDSSIKHLGNFTMFFHSVICALGVIGNGLVIYITGFKMKKTVNTICFLNLAVADFLFTFFLILGIIWTSQNYNWIFGDFMCKFYSFVFVLNMFASIFLLTAISLDRCLSTWVIVWVQNQRTLFKARVCCFFIWLISGSCSVPFCVYRKARFNESKNTTICLQDYDSATYKHLIIFRFMVGFLIPFMIITGSYLSIGIRVRRLHQKTMKPFKVIMVVILAFFFCWLPYHIYLFIDLWTYETRNNNKEINLNEFKKVLNHVGPAVTSLAYLNSCLNPFLYVFMCEEFKKKLKHSLVAVFESAFAEEQLALLVSQYSIRHRKSHSRSVPVTDDTQSSSINP